MTLPDIDDADTFGGADLVDYVQAPVDSTTDRGANGVNPLVADVAAMTHTAVRAWAQFTPAGGGAPTVNKSDALWAKTSYTPPTAARTTTGVYTLTWPTQVYDEVPNGAPGYVGPHALNLRGGTCGCAGAGAWLCSVLLTSANVLTVNFYNPTTGALQDPSGLPFNLLAF